MRPRHSMRRAPGSQSADRRVDLSAGAPSSRVERARRFVVALALGLAFLASAESSSRADLAPPREAPGPRPRFTFVPKVESSPPVPDASAADPVVVSVGSVEVRASELAFLLGRLHEFERASYGDTPEAVKRGFLERRLVPELLAQAEAQRTGVDRKPAIASRVAQQLGEALKASIQQDVDAKLTEREIREYCQSEGGRRPAGKEGARACDGDLSGYRIALRRTRASGQLSALVSELEKSVRGVDRELLARISVSPTGAVSAAAAPASGEQAKGSQGGE